MSSPIRYFILSLLAVAIGAALRWWLPPSPVQEIRHVSEALRTEFALFETEASKVTRALQTSDPEAFDNRHFAFFLYEGQNLIRWSDNAIIPRQLPIGTTSLNVLVTPQGDFLVKNWPLPDSTVLSGMITLRRKYPITNQYLSTSWNKGIFSTATKDILVPQSARGYEIRHDVSGEVLFRIDVEPDDLHPLSWSSKLEFVLYLLASVTFLVALILWVRRIHDTGRYWLASLVLFTGVFGLRRLMVAVQFPEEFFHSSVFDPALFASSDFNNSIGNLFINTFSLLMLAIYANRTFSRWSFWKYFRRGEQWLRVGGTVLMMVAAIFSFLLPFLYFETVYHNSAINIDIMRSLSFSAVEILALMSILLSCVAAWYFVRIFFRLSLAMTGQSTFIHLTAVAVGALVLFIYHWATDRHYEIPIVLGALFLSALFFVQRVMLNRARRLREYGIVATGVIFFAAMSALSVRQLAEERQLEDQIRFAGSQLERDVLGEYLLHETAQHIAGDAFIRARMASPFLSKSPVRQKVRRMHLNNYFDRYQVNVFLYDGTGGPMDEGVEPLQSFLKSFESEAAKTDYERIYFVDVPVTGVMKRYIAVVPIQQGNWLAGFVVLDLSLKRILPQNVYPELLVDNRFGQYLRIRDFSSALFDENEIISTSGTFNYDEDFQVSWLGRPALYRSGIQDQGMTHVGMDNGTGKVVVVTARAYTGYAVFSNFSFFVLTGLLLLLVLLALRGVDHYLLRRETMQFATKIQVFVFVAFSLPLLAVSLTTLRVISTSSREQTEADFGTRSMLLTEKVAPQWISMNRSEISEGEFESELLQESDAAGIDASIFSATGRLLATTEPDLYDNQLLSRYLNPLAWNRMVAGRENQLVLTERIGLLTYSNYYTVVRSPETRQVLGILSVPFLESADSQRDAEIRVLANILNIFIAVFMVFSVLSFFAASRLTYPLSLVTKTLRRTSLVGENQPMSWEAEDEMGALVREYNRMVENLRRSRDELAQRQRETAWRDIARQVAHEIKNPLTPMKLTLQQMERKLQSGEQSQERTAQSVQSMLQQVEVLNDIATSFSSFAQMPSLTIESTDVVELVGSAMELLSVQPGATIVFDKPQQAIPVMADAKLLSRIFSNLALNAIQSRDEQRPLCLNIRIAVQDDSCIVSFEDNGTGIPPALKEKVFLPYFSTKKTGSGIGLAVARQGIEQMGGKIWFDSLYGKGSTFNVQLPLA
ncbi:MAG: ATP-binding protein [Cyclobacteriaceae bacterium]